MPSMGSDASPANCTIQRLKVGVTIGLDLILRRENTHLEAV